MQYFIDENEEFALNSQYKNERFKGSMRNLIDNLVLFEEQRQWFLYPCLSPWRLF